MELKVHTGADGKFSLYETHHPQPHAKLAQSLLPALLSSDMIRQVVSDSDEAQFHPRKIASLACDVAQAFFDEAERREWHLPLPPPGADKSYG
jgi:hypothetical protein